MWLIRQFWLFYNIDPSLLEGCSTGEKVRFAIYGLLSLLVVIFAFFSVGYLGFLVTQSWIGAVAIGGVLGWNFSNLYRLVLTTISAKSSGPSLTSTGSSISIFLRGLFLVLLVIIIIKPFEILIYESQIAEILDQNTEQQKRELNEEWLGFIDDKIVYYEGRIRTLQQAKRQEQQLLRNSSSLSTELKETTQKSIDRIDSQLSTLRELQSWFQQTRSEYTKDFQETSSHSNNLIERFRVLNQYYPESWLMTFILGIVFLFPILVKAVTKNRSQYYNLEAESAERLIVQEYASFKEAYQRLMAESTGKPIAYYEPYEDPPFNSKPTIVEDSSKGEEAFKDWISNFS